MYRRNHFARPVKKFLVIRNSHGGCDLHCAKFLMPEFERADDQWVSMT